MIASPAIIVIFSLIIIIINSYIFQKQNAFVTGLGQVDPILFEYASNQMLKLLVGLWIVTVKVDWIGNLE